MNNEEVLQRLREGNKRFVADKPAGRLRDREQRQSLCNGQSPWAVILGCADSRVAPELIFDTGLGELFTVRVAGNVANTSSIASIEYAVAHLHVGVIVVLGHECCGAVAAAVDGGNNGYNLNHLLAHITPALEQARGGDMDAIIVKNAELAAAELIARSSILAGALADGSLKIIPAYYRLGSGEVEFLAE